MKIHVNEVIQWVGAVFIIAGHSLNAVGPAAYPWNIVTFFRGHRGIPDLDPACA